MIPIAFDPDTATPLCEIMNQCGSDKGNRHNYTRLYFSLLNGRRNSPLRVFELGVGSNNMDVPCNMGPDGKPGASLYGWRHFFPNGQIYAADIDQRILFESSRIRTFFCDQTDDNSICLMWEAADLQQDFDLIIDDGLHTFAANICFFENSIHKLKAGGYYIIEDISKCDIDRFEEKIAEWRITYQTLSFWLVQLASELKPLDNNLLVVYRDDYIQS